LRMSWSGSMPSKCQLFYEVGVFQWGRLLLGCQLRKIHGMISVKRVFGN